MCGCLTARIGTSRRRMNRENQESFASDRPDIGVSETPGTNSLERNLRSPQFSSFRARAFSPKRGFGGSGISRIRGSSRHREVETAPVAVSKRPKLPMATRDGAVRRVNFGPFYENRVHHILHQKCEPHQAKEFEKNIKI